MLPSNDSEWATASTEKRPFRVLFFGMTGTFSRLILQQLFNQDFIEVVGIVVSQNRLSPQLAAIEQLREAPALAQLPLLATQHPPTLIEIGHQLSLPVFALRQPKGSQVVPTLAALKPDVACVACFSHRIPRPLLDLPIHGFLNVHPSLLPAFRGPEPLFWIFRHNKQEAGVTIHFMDEELDSGDIALQAPIMLPDGIWEWEADQLCAELGGKLLVEALGQMRKKRLLRQKQGENGRYFPAPTPEDFTVPLHWSARHAFNFMRGTSGWKQPYTIEGLATKVRGETAVAYYPDAQLSQPIVYSDHKIQIQFNPGVLTLSNSSFAESA